MNINLKKYFLILSLLNINIIILSSDKPIPDSFWDELGELSVEKPKEQTITEQEAQQIETNLFKEPNPPLLSIAAAHTHVEKNNDLEEKSKKEVEPSKSKIRKRGTKRKADDDIAKKTCTVCNRNFRTPAELIRHMRIHTGEKPFSCQYCGKTFALESNLTRHIPKHSGENKYQCECGKKYRYPSGLKNHKDKCLK